MTARLRARYRDAAGDTHSMRLERSPSGNWRVIDVGPAGETLVEELTGFDDRRPQAEALARDYAEQADLAARGGREDVDVTWAA